MTQKTLAFETDFEIRQIKRIENGEVNASISHIAAIAKAFNFTLSEFLDFD
jgi:transcriptional regulator with XRE-family HTH domain